MVILKASAGSDVNRLGRAIEHYAYKDGSLEVHAVGNNAIGRAVWAIAIANKLSERRGFTLVNVPLLRRGKDKDGKSMTITKFIVGRRNFK